MRPFGLFRRPKLETVVPLTQLCYDVAYFVLPHYAFKDLPKLTHLCLNTPRAAGPFFYLMAAELRSVQADAEAADRFRWHHGQLSGGREYLALEYPVPPPVDLSGVPMEQLLEGRSEHVLAPHFSAIICGGGAVQYFIPGQAPMGGGTTLRCILPEGTNCNLGPGPEPELAAFLDAIRERTTG
ncbi:MAG: hypothetical protein HY321_00215 [Armatimonadetes bacterium]|nr:hypothetical protein [Armatimonadota bacterium]